MWVCQYEKIFIFNRFSLLLRHCPGKAGRTEMIGEYDDWVAYYYRDSAGPVCYMASTPKKTRANTAAAATFMRL